MCVGFFWDSNFRYQCFFQSKINASNLMDAITYCRKWLLHSLRDRMEITFSVQIIFASNSGEAAGKWHSFIKFALSARNFFLSRLCAFVLVISKCSTGIRPVVKVGIDKRTKWRNTVQQCATARQLVQLVPTMFLVEVVPCFLYWPRLQNLFCDL